MLDRIEQLNIELSAERKTVIAVLEILRTVKRSTEKSLRLAFIAAVREHFDCDYHRCRVCNEYLARNLMTLDAMTPTGVRSLCLICAKVDSNERYWKQPEHSRTLRAQSRRRLNARRKTEAELRQTRGERIKAGLAARKERMAK
jgi:hypothetical protein